MSADRWNEALEAAAKACEKWADKYRLSTTHRTDDLVAAAMMCSQAILALREVEDQRGADARELPAPSEARVAADGGTQPTNTPTCVSVPADTGINAKGDCDSVAQQPAQSAPHHPGGQPVAWTTVLSLELAKGAFYASPVNLWAEKGIPIYTHPGGQEKGDGKPEGDGKPAPASPGLMVSAPDARAVELAKSFLSGKTDLFYSHDAGHLSREILRLAAAEEKRNET